MYWYLLEKEHQYFFKCFDYLYIKSRIKKYQIEISLIKFEQYTT